MPDGLVEHFNKIQETGYLMSKASEIIGLIVVDYYCLIGIVHLNRTIGVFVGFENFSNNHDSVQATVRYTIFFFFFLFDS